VIDIDKLIANFEALKAGFDSLAESNERLKVLTRGVAADLAAERSANEELHKRLAESDIGENERLTRDLELAHLARNAVIQQRDELAALLREARAKDGLESRGNTSLRARIDAVLAKVEK
jgi:hypothetical protein